MSKYTGDLFTFLTTITYVGIMIAPSAPHFYMLYKVLGGRLGWQCRREFWRCTFFKKKIFCFIYPYAREANDEAER